MNKFIPKYEFSFHISDYLKYLFEKNKCDEFEKHIEKYFLERKIYFTNYGRVGLYLILKLLLEMGNRRIGLQAYTCSSVFNVIKFLNLEPVYIDINSNYNLDLEDLEKKKNLFDILLVTHTFGIPAEISEYKKVIKNKYIIEDCSHSFFSKINCQYTGLIGDASIYSFGIGKMPAIGTGGALVVNNPDLIENIEKIYTRIETPSKFKEFQIIVKLIISSFIVNNRFTGPIFDYFGSSNKRKSIERIKSLKKDYNFFRSFFIEKLRDVERSLSLKRKIGMKILENIDQKYNPVLEKENTEFNFFRIPLLDNDRCYRIKILRRNNIMASMFFKNSLIWASKYHYKIGLCKNTEKIASSIFTIPVSLKYEDSEINFIIKNLNENIH